MSGSTDELIGGRTENEHLVTPDASKIHSVKSTQNLVKLVWIINILNQDSHYPVRVGVKKYVFLGLLDVCNKNN